MPAGAIIAYGSIVLKSLPHWLHVVRQKTIFQIGTARFKQIGQIRRICIPLEPLRFRQTAVNALIPKSCGMT